MKILKSIIATAFLFCCMAGLLPTDVRANDMSERNLSRAITLADAAFGHYFSSSSMKMSRYYNPFTDRRSKETASVWMYTSAIEACNAILEGLDCLAERGIQGFEGCAERFTSYLDRLYEDLVWYEGTFTLTSYTQTREWTVYGVNRGRHPSGAEVAGIMNVYDDQQWLVRELLVSYRLTGERKYLEKAEYLAEYVLDGWDVTLDHYGREHGGITWGPGYISKHSCSNGPFVSPLVWLHEIYKGCDDVVQYRYIDENKARKVKQMTKEEYYLMYAEKVYSFQKRHLLRPDTGVYFDMLGGYKAHTPDGIAYETVDGHTYRANNRMTRPTGRAYSYNSGTMLSGAADLYRCTGKEEYHDDMTKLSDSCFKYFAHGPAENGLYRYAFDGFNNWFNCVLLRGWIDVADFYQGASSGCLSFQDNLDYAWENHLRCDMLPSDLLGGWRDNEHENYVEAMFTFAFASKFAYLAGYLSAASEGASDVK